MFFLKAEAKKHPAEETQNEVKGEVTGASRSFLGGKGWGKEGQACRINRFSHMVNTAA